jgi:hypothetical protein
MEGATPRGCRTSAASPDEPAARGRGEPPRAAPGRRRRPRWEDVAPQRDLPPSLLLRLALWSTSSSSRRRRGHCGGGGGFGGRKGSGVVGAGRRCPASRSGVGGLGCGRCWCWSPPWRGGEPRWGADRRPRWGADRDRGGEQSGGRGGERIRRPRWGAVRRVGVAEADGGVAELEETGADPRSGGVEAKGAVPRR